MIIKRKTIFDLLNEAEDDNVETFADVGQDEAPSSDQSGEDATTEDDSGGDDDFNIDTSLDDEGNDDSSGDDLGGGGDDLGSDTSSDVSSEEEAPVQANTDLFGSLPPEEQKMKIMELKRLYSELYSSTDDLLERINQTNTDEDNIEIIGRITSSLYAIRQYMLDYITHIFPAKPYMENDFNFNRFLAIINGIGTVIEEIGAIKIAKSDKPK